MTPAPPPSSPDALPTLTPSSPDALTTLTLDSFPLAADPYPLTPTHSPLPTHP